MCVAVITDFGTQDNYVGIMKGVIKKINPDVDIIDINNNITPFNIKEGAYNLLTAFPYFPNDTVFLVVVDPGVGSKRRPVCLRVYTGQYVIAPDNGVLSFLIDYLIEKSIKFDIRVIENQEYQLNNTSDTFHGRDIFSPASAYISKGVDFSSIGDIINTNEVIKLKTIKPEIFDEGIRVSVINIDHFGNIITSLKVNEMLKYFNYGDLILLEINNNKFEILLGKTFSDGNIKDFILYSGSSGYIELGINQGSVVSKLDINYDSKIVFKFKVK